MRHSLPVGYPSGNCVLVAFDVDLVPVLASALSQLLEKRFWEEEAYQVGYYAIGEVIAQMTSACFTQLVQEIRDFRGVLPDFVSTPVEERTSDMYNSLNTLFDKLLELRGIMDDGWFTDTYTTLKDVVQAMRGTNQTQGTSIFDDVKGLLDGEADVATIIDAISGFLGDIEGTAVEGGLLLSLVAMTAANSALFQAQALAQVTQLDQLNAIISALRGASAPTDNILQAIRGDTPADVDRNLVELLV